MHKFVTFEEKIAHTIQKSENKNFSDVESKRKTDYTEIPGYVVVNQRIYKIKKYKWKEDDWANYHYWLKKLTQKGKLEKRKLLIMAAWDQTKGCHLPHGVVL